MYLQYICAFMKHDDRIYYWFSSIDAGSGYFPLIHAGDEGNGRDMKTQMRYVDTVRVGQMKVVPLQQTNRHHTDIVLSMVVQSTLDYGDIDADVRLLSWQNCVGRWAVATNDSGRVVGIVCVVDLNDDEKDALLWLEVLPQEQHKGVGDMLFAWARTQTQRDLVIKSVASARGFYQRYGVQLSA